MVTNRPFVNLTIIFTLGIIAVSYLPASPRYWLVLAGTAFSLNIFIFITKKKLLTETFLLFVFFTGACWYCTATAPAVILQSMTDKMVQGEGIIVSYPGKSEYYTNFQLAVENLRCEEKIYRQQKVILKVRTIEGIEYLPGMKVSFSGYLQVPSQRRNPGGFDYRKFLANQQIYSIVSCSNIRVIETERSFRYLAARGRQEVAEYLRRVLPEEERGLILGILFGDVSSINDRNWELYQRAGIVHLFAVSGFNVAVILAMTWFLLSFFQPKPLIRIFIGIWLLLGYYFLVGWGASIARACIMGFMGLLALAVNRKKDFYTSLAAAGLVILIINPGELFQAGFQLSFITTAGLVYLTRWFQKQGCNNIISPVLAAQISSLPLIAYHFNRISLIAPLINIVAAFVCAVVIVLSITACIFVWTVPVMAEPLFITSGAIMHVLNKIVLWGGELNWASMAIASPSLLIVALLYVFIILLPFAKRIIILSQLRYKKLLTFLVLITCFIAIYTLMLPENELQVTFLDVGQGDCIYIKTPGGKVILIDGGGTPNSDYSVGLKIVKPFLESQGVNSIDMMVMTHSDLDHCEGLSELLPVFKVKAWAQPYYNNDRMVELLNELCRKQGTIVLELHRGQRVKIENEVYLEVLHPPSYDEADGNNHSLVLRLVYQEAKWLFTGDIEKDAVLKLLNSKQDICADVLKIPHHGSIGSYDENFYQAVVPQVAVISVGKNNYGQPHRKVMSYFAAHKIQCYTTLESGGIVTKSNGKRIVVQPTLQ